MITVFLHHKLLNNNPSAGLTLLACLPTAIQAADGSAQTFTVKLGGYRYTSGQDCGMESTLMMNPAQ